MGRLVEPRDHPFSEGDPSIHHRKPGLAVLNSHLVGIDGSEEHLDVEGEGGGSGGGGATGDGGGGVGGDAHVLHAHLLEIKLGLLGLNSEDDDEDDGEDEESEEGEEEEEAAATAFEGCRGGRIGRRLVVAMVLTVRVVVVVWGRA